MFGWLGRAKRPALSSREKTAMEIRMRSIKRLRHLFRGRMLTDSPRVLGGWGLAVKLKRQASVKAVCSAPAGRRRAALSKDINTITRNHSDCVRAERSYFRFA